MHRPMIFFFLNHSKKTKILKTMFRKFYSVIFFSFSHVNFQLRKIWKSYPPKVLTASNLLPKTTIDIKDLSAHSGRNRVQRHKKDTSLLKQYIPRPIQNQKFIISDFSGIIIERKNNYVSSNLIFIELSKIMINE